ncbi:MAG: ABC transporter substrate-binding protein [Sphingobacteriales bacterium]|nr:ABC transporter substrate-binding protein [Sphingobacteriales bacterium]
MRSAIDQCGRSIRVPDLPERIISLVPSQTELLYDLGLREEVCGITKFCIHPDAWYRSKTKVGGTKQVKTAAILQLQPDLIIAGKEENSKEQVLALEHEFPVWVSDVSNLSGALDMIQQVGWLTGKTVKAAELVDGIREAFSSLVIEGARPRAACLIWKDPYMAAGGGTFIHSMMEAAGFENIFKPATRYPAFQLPELRALHCEIVFLSSEPYPFKEKHRAELQAQLPGTKIIRVDGELFSWYGSRLLKAPAYFQKLRDQVK